MDAIDALETTEVVGASAPATSSQGVTEGLSVEEVEIGKLELYAAYARLDKKDSQGLHLVGERNVTLKESYTIRDSGGNKLTIPCEEKMCAKCSTVFRPKDLCTKSTYADENRFYHHYTCALGCLSP